MTSKRTSSKYLLPIALAALALIGAAAYGLSATRRAAPTAASLYTAEAKSHRAADASAPTGRVEISPASVELGTIAPSSKPVTRTITVKNIGAAPLQIKNLTTSCGCTTAVMDRAPLPPGGTREMRVTFDPAVHPDARGPILRIVYLQTSDPTRPEAEIEVHGTITAGKPAL